MQQSELTPRTTDILQKRKNKITLKIKRQLITKEHLCTLYLHRFLGLTIACVSFPAISHCHGVFMHVMVCVCVCVRLLFVAVKGLGLCVTGCVFNSSLTYYVRMYEF